MNFLTIGVRTLKAAEKARSTANLAKWKAEEISGLTYTGIEPQEAFDRTIASEYARMEQAFDIGLTYYDMAQRKLGKSNGGRWYMLTTRPPPGTNWHRYFHAVTEFVNKWKSQWCGWEYAFEQTGKSIETMGSGFHCHILFETTKPNYYPSHILRDAKSSFPFIAANCIQVDTIVNITKAKAYIRGNKKEEKLEGVSFNTPWRSSLHIQEIYSSEEPGQVQPGLVKEF